MSNLLPSKGESLKIILIILLGWTFFSFVDVTNKYLSQTYTPSLIIVIGATINFTFISLWIFFKKGLKGFKSKNWPWLILRALSVGFISFGIVTAFSHMPIADVYGITFTSPFLGIILATFILKEYVGWQRWVAVIVGFIGVLVLIGPQFSHMNAGILYALLATVSIATGTIAIRKIGRNESMPLMMFYSFLGMLVVNVPILWPDFHMPRQGDEWLFIMNAAFVLIGITCTIYGFSHAKNTAAIAPFLYIQVIWGVLFGIIIFGDYPTAPTIAGLAIVIAAGLYTIYRERTLGKHH